MNDIIEMLISYFGLALVAAGAQNAVFTRALGISSGLRMLHDSKKSTGYFCAALTVFQLMSVVIVYFALPLVDVLGFGQYRRFVLPAIVVAACTVSYVVIIVLLSIIMGDKFKDVVRSVTSASINSAIVGTVILTVYQGLDFGESIAFALGSSIGYFLAIVLISEGERKIAHDRVPEAFRGLPITLIYISILALGIYGLIGHMIAF
ncbi:MAG: hypothetical protein IJN59_00170 [Oscillospiraceae bacterium]|nr:hypothetical protein [Oscillospiraceae bacterium]